MEDAMRLILAAILVLTGPRALAYTADQLALKNVAAKGGIEKLHAIDSLRFSGKLLINGDSMKLDYVALIHRPHSVRYEAKLQGLTQVQAYDGAQAWQINPFDGRREPEKLSTDDAKAMGEDAADFTGVLVDYKAKGYILDYLGTEDVDGTEAHKLRVTRPNGDIAYVYLDPDFFLEIRTISRRMEHGVPKEWVTDYGDYEKVAGAYFAFAQTSYLKGSKERQKLQFDRAEPNAAKDEALFHFPGPHEGAASGR
jgi:hypothetical protein